MWQLSDDPKATVTYRSFSKSGGTTIDYNGVDGPDMKRIHIPQHGENRVVVNQDAYRSELEYLTRYAHDDWIGFSVVSGSVGSLLGRGASFQEQLTLLLRIIGDLYDAGVRAGELTESAAEPFLPWPLEKADALGRIAAEVRHLSQLPDSGDICWFMVP
ncbi:hypothetical protein OG259_33915 [Streptomyces sp. NBC_00250]|uniref:hypothetical protein n=1 Tax=Streptomyces sp. NBC_00250 TaxID=2903641 RepID=UPI002E2D62B5|nr:hypothetical protein [Streptomyces sp. NBC_00250]